MPVKRRPTSLEEIPGLWGFAADAWNVGVVIAFWPLVLFFLLCPESFGRLKLWSEAHP